MNIKRLIAVAFAAIVVVPAFAQTVFSNNVGGDSFTHAGINTQSQDLVNSPTAPVVNLQGQPAVARWQYDDVRNSGTVGIDTTYARSGNGSARITTPIGSSTQASIAFTANPTDSVTNPGDKGFGGSFATFGSLTGWGYDIYRNEAYDNNNLPASLQMVARVELFTAAGGFGSASGYLGNLIFIPDAAQNVSLVGTLADDTWHTIDIFAIDGYLANSRALTIGATTFSAFSYRRLSEWQADLGLSTFMSQFNAGVGSHSNQYFDGAVDNYRINIAAGALPALNATYNFEAVPEPATMSILALAAALKRRKAKKNA
ncbi:MAG: hypothetical protein LCH41_05825 [Armatimonadetes bacterium]|nr:hypothetical protein [Armatimonadota bacterium]